jgi:hypothetical protein
MATFSNVLRELGLLRGWADYIPTTAGGKQEVGGRKAGPSAVHGGLWMTTA